MVINFQIAHSWLYGSEAQILAQLLNTELDTSIA